MRETFRTDGFIACDSFLEYSTPAACWTLIGISIRLAQDVGAHRQREGPPTVESELWKRGFWVFVSYDRQVACLYPPEADLHHPSPSVFAPALHPSPAGNQFGSFPTYTADLGKLPVFHQRTPPPRESTSSWYPTQAASPLGPPDFAVGIVPPDADNTANSFPVDLLFASKPDYALGTSNLSNDVMAMWVTAPTGCEIDDWGVYLNVMSELNQGFETPVPQS
ncbi:hypothetical protein B0H14DRAFT_3140291 [Mycena olivaceomarginata]|nr:hypothetical protein B0H14DRAFT_3140291 [Mycena olivaceomarginata]